MIHPGVEILLQEQLNLLKGRRIGLLTNMTGLDHRMRSTIDIFYDHPDIHLTALFGPEHGIRGDGQEGKQVQNYTDPSTQLPVFSLYGKSRKPTRDMLSGLDTIVVDIQDIGVRYYTFISTLSYVMEACMDEGKEVVVLDRPNPVNGVYREGNIPEASLRSFVGLHAIPNRHGLTIGELALIYKHLFGINCSLSVVPMKGWNRSMFFRDTGMCWVQPSPNSTGQIMAVLYTGMCLIEGTELSEGRGTTRPFEVVGAPYIDGKKLAGGFNELHLPGVLARPTSFVPCYSKYKGQLCYGVQIHVLDLTQVQSLKVGVYLLGLIADMYPDQFMFRDETNDRSMFHLLAGNRRLKQMVRENNFGDYFDQCQDDCRQFTEKVTPFFLYK
ncbi:exo-beta-N-acetylmuramidase NamZ domain-containing protein [Sporolactobacillus sp. THM19-2]|uniref:exo-beta-N-acetylmuramidase NamZ family protein n=1 Tax=Sporolactobacillus sp. THM19-2 TaxID=2511171 RepID=UPI00101F4FC8|nr:DUF1343 domain-containing protein [Sporolactobacillus sp. THM19-2]RYL94480.1 DUF1343 domain-containing protein [Sporolactobacillus sp. THM19-2]